MQIDVFVFCIICDGNKFDKLIAEILENGNIFKKKMRVREIKADDYAGFKKTLDKLHLRRKVLNNPEVSHLLMIHLYLLCKHTNEINLYAL